MSIFFLSLFRMTYNGVLIVLSCLSSVLHAQEVETNAGRVQGYSEEIDGSTLDIYLGIPYARPPVGELRFKRPLPVEPWEGVHDATTLPNSCWQMVDTTFDQFPGVDMWNPNTDMSEDCLYLNVWAPQRKETEAGAGAGDKLAVMVWIYGGGLYSGTSTLELYDGRMLAVTGNVVVVSMQYRLGALGFLYSGSDDAPGNVGFVDQYLAIKWVRDNIDAFGGDRDRITIIGESAGSVSVSAHLLSPLSQPLISHAIMMSGTLLSDWVV